jgi:hypothetical protein
MQCSIVSSNTTNEDMIRQGIPQIQDVWQSEYTLMIYKSFEKKQTELFVRVFVIK